MGEYKHLKVLHKGTNKIVSIYKILFNLEWQGKERDEFVAIPADTPKGVKEIQMCFTKGFERYKGTNKEQRVTAFFKRKPGQEMTLSEIRNEGESETHKLAKNEVYEKLFNNELTINGKTIQTLNVEDLDISEEQCSEDGKAIADVLIKFGNYPYHHPVYGLGINIEIQFSKQNEEKTFERTLNRLMNGWSTIWLWKEDFDDYGNLKVKNLRIMPREKHLELFKKKLKEKASEDLISLKEIYDGTISLIKDNFTQEIKKIEKENSEKLEWKANFCNQNLENLAIKGESIIKSVDEKIKEQSKEVITKIGEHFSKKEEEIKQTKIKIIDKDINERIIELMREETIKEQIINQFKEKITQSVMTEIIDEISTRQKEMVDALKGGIISKIGEDKEFISTIMNVWEQQRIERLQKRFEEAFPLYVRDFFMSHVDDMLIKIYEDRFGDIDKRLKNIKTERELYEPEERYLVNKSYQSKEVQNKLGEIPNGKEEK